MATHVLVDRQAVSEACDQKAAKAAPTGKEKVKDDPSGLAQGASEEWAFQIPDVQAVAGTVLKWQAEDAYVQAAKECLLEGKSSKLRPLINNSVRPLQSMQAHVF